MRKVFIVTASGPEPYEHYQDTIKHKRNLSEIQDFISDKEVGAINKLYHGTSFAVWGALPGPGNTNTWTRMEEGDYVAFYQQSKFTLIGEVAYKLHSENLAKYFWGTNSQGKTWENIYLIINEREINVPLEKFNQFLNYKSNFTPQGFAAIEKERQKEFEKTYGDFYGLMLKINEGRADEIQKISPIIAEQEIIIPSEKPEREPTEHDEIQWKLIKLGKSAGNDVWVPKSDQNKKYEEFCFRDFVLKEFERGLDVPKPIENIDCVWRFGFQIKSAFEIEHSTAIYSGILRLSDLRSVAPNSNYPLFIVAPRERRPQVFEQVRRPTFSNPYLKLKEAIRFLSYENIRDLDEKFSDKNYGLTTEMVINVGEVINGQN